METPICALLGIDVPIFAFSYCRDVVAAVTRAGGFGVLGASTRHGHRRHRAPPRPYRQAGPHDPQRVIRARRADLYSAPVGQSVGALTGETGVADVLYRLQEEYGDAVERLKGWQ